MMHVVNFSELLVHSIGGGENNRKQEQVLAVILQPASRLSKHFKEERRVH